MTSVGMVLCEKTPRVVPCIPRGLRDGTDSRDGAV